MTNEPSAVALSGRSPLRVAKRLFLATRPMFISASVLPVLLGTASGWRAFGQLDGGVLLLGLAAIACVHAAGNVLNDVNDDRGGTDRVNEDRIFPFTGGSRFIQNEIMSRRGLANAGSGAPRGDRHAFTAASLGGHVELRTRRGQLLN